jgi:hypothetical protein
VICGVQNGIGTGFSAFPYAPVIIIPLALHIRILLHTAVTKSTHWRSPVTLWKAMLFAENWSIG